VARVCVVTRGIERVGGGRAGAVVSGVRTRARGGRNRPTIDRGGGKVDQEM
jgi:hypothetical protein